MDKSGSMFRWDYQIESVVFIMSLLGDELNQVVTLQNILQALVQSSIDPTRAVVVTNQNVTPVGKQTLVE
jgi:hypothetical protein